MWKANRYDNEYLTHEQADGIAADIRESRASLDKLEAACNRGEHPNRLKDYINDVSGWMSFARSFCDRAARHADERHADKMAKLAAWEKHVKENPAKRIA